MLAANYGLDTSNGFDAVTGVLRSRDGQVDHDAGRRRLKACGVVAAAAIQRVVAGSAVQHVVSPSADQDVVAEQAINDFVGSRASQRIVASRAVDPGCRQKDARFDRFTGKGRLVGRPLVGLLLALALVVVGGHGRAQYRFGWWMVIQWARSESSLCAPSAASRFAGCCVALGCSLRLRAYLTADLAQLDVAVGPQSIACSARARCRRWPDVQFELGRSVRAANRRLLSRSPGQRRMPLRLRCMRA